MANKFRGEATLKVEGGDDLTLIFDANAFCEIEEATGLGVQGVVDLMTKADQVGMKHMRLLLWATAKRKHDLTLDEAGDVISDVGLEETMDAIMAAMSAAMPKVVKNPRKPPVAGQSGTGTKP
jgi:hypothetical protein